MAATAQSTALVLSDMKQNEGLAFREAFSDRHITDVFARYGDDFRDRAYPPDLTLMAFCTQIISANNSCQEAVVKVNRDREISGLKPLSSSTSAYCQARGRLSLKLIQDFGLESGSFIDSASPKEWRPYCGTFDTAKAKMDGSRNLRHNA